MKTIGSYERTAVLMATSVHLGRRHTIHFARRFSAWCGLSEADAAAITSGELPSDPWLAELIAVSWLLLDTRGELASSDVWDLDAAGVSASVVNDVARLIRVRVTWPDGRRSGRRARHWHGAASRATRPAGHHRA